MLLRKQFDSILLQFNKELIQQKVDQTFLIVIENYIDKKELAVLGREALNRRYVGMEEQFLVPHHVIIHLELTKKQRNLQHDRFLQKKLGKMVFLFSNL